jgi:phosphoribosylformylglycinamidine synthase
LRLKGTGRAIAVATDGNGRYCYLDPLVGGRIAVAEAARNVSCTGATPLAATDCLNFGNPEKPAVYYQLQQVIEGMAQACEALGAPVVSGNVSLYNESGGEAIYPTPVVGVLGLMDDVARNCPPRFQRAGDVIALLGDTLDELGASEYLAAIHGLVAGQVPRLDLHREAAVQRLCRQAIARGLLRSAHDCSDGGLAVALVESCSGPYGLPPDDAAAGAPPCGWPLGARVEVPDAWRAMRADAVLFGESQSRIVVSLAPEDWAALEALAGEHGVPVHRLGTTGGERVVLAPYVDLPLAGALATHATALEALLRRTSDVGRRTSDVGLGEPPGARAPGTGSLL